MLLHEHDNCISHVAAGASRMFRAFAHCSRFVSCLSTRVQYVCVAFCICVDLMSTAILAQFSLCAFRVTSRGCPGRSGSPYLLDDGINADLDDRSYVY